MKVQAFGLNKYDFIDEKTGERKEGVSVHYTCKPESNKWFGLQHGKFSVKVDSDMYGILMALQLPCELRLYFNRYGKVDDFELLEE